MSDRSLALATGLALICGLGWVQAGCGVRGRPQAPLTPAQIGRGSPTFTGGSEEFAFPSVPSPGATPAPRKSPPRGEAN